MHHPNVGVHLCGAFCVLSNALHICMACHAYVYQYAASLAMQCKARGESITTDIDRVFNKLVKRPRGG